jgi:hypothetical protein
MHYIKVVLDMTFKDIKTKNLETACLRKVAISSSSVKSPIDQSAVVMKERMAASHLI